MKWLEENWQYVMVAIAALVCFIVFMAILFYKGFLHIYHSL